MSTPRQSVGVIGLGIMGSAMSANLVKAGFAVTGYDPVPVCRSALSRAGGRAVRSTAVVAKRAGIIITSLPSSEALADASAELARTGRRGQIVIEASTLPIEVKQAARKVLAARGITLLDCPLSGTGAQARTRDLVVYASGESAAYRKCTAVFEGFARAHFLVGPFGDGSKMKFVANLLVAIHNVAAAEAIVLGIKAGLDPAKVLKIVSSGAGTSRMLEVRGPMMVKGDYSEATMKVSVWQKDMKIIAEYARSIDCPTPLFLASAPFYTAAMAMGRGREDTGSVCAVLEEMAGSRRSRKRNLGSGLASTPRFKT
ncbi:MAG: NAD(P)-dependent oxidoreductase [Betaproteobacteria bacterium]|nr:NAD(P)-dependent oxidoreductase [Betaproteobacteria bacterium]